MEFANIETALDSLDSSVIFHVITDILGVRPVHAPTNTFATVVFQPEMKASIRRKHTARKREVKQGLRRIEKLMRTIASLKDALQHLITEIPNIERVTLVLGPSPLRPPHVYELHFSHGRTVSADFSRARVAEGLSKKAIRTLISRGAGSEKHSCAAV